MQEGVFTPHITFRNGTHKKLAMAGWVCACGQEKERNDENLSCLLLVSGIILYLILFPAWQV